MSCDSTSPRSWNCSCAVEAKRRRGGGSWCAVSSTSLCETETGPDAASVFSHRDGAEPPVRAAGRMPMRVTTDRCPSLPPNRRYSRTGRLSKQGTREGDRPWGTPRRSSTGIILSTRVLVVPDGTSGDGEYATSSVSFVALLLLTVLLAAGAGQCGKRIVDVDESRRASRGEQMLQKCSRRSRPIRSRRSRSSRVLSSSETRSASILTSPSISV